MSDRPAPKTPWLAVEIEHHFRHGVAGFHLRLCFEARAARTVVFGPSGSGKSSLLRAIAGLLQPDSGKIDIHGQTVWQKTIPAGQARAVPTEKRRVGLVMQNPAVFPHLTVAANVAFALRGTEKSARTEKVFDLLRKVNAETLAHRRPRELSGGQLQRVAIARTLAAAPSILLLDEPFAALDAESREQLSENVHEWARVHNVPVLTVTHSLEEAFAAGNEVIAIQEGRIRAQGKAAEVLGEEREGLLRAVNAVGMESLKQFEF